MTWPGKTEREKFEISGFIEAYARLPEERKFELVSKGEKPDYIVKDKHSGEEYGIELTSVYMNDRSVPDRHMKKQEEITDIPFDNNEIEKYTKRIIAAIIEKICKAWIGYDLSWPLILAVYVNEYISIYMDETDFEEFIQNYEGLFNAINPFTEVVFWNLGNSGVFSVRPK